MRLGGLRVRTTIDLKKQQEARAAIAERLGGIGPSSAIVTINPRNGYIEAMASSADYGESKFNLAAQGHRQPGSTFKVMALMAALREGVDPDRTHYVSRVADEVRRPAVGPDQRQDLRRPSARQPQPSPGDAEVGQLGLHPARARPRARQGQAGGVRPRHPLEAPGLPGRDARRPRRRRLAARDGQRLRDDRLRRHAQPADRDHASDVPRRPQGAARALQGQAHARLRGRRDRQGDRHPRAEHPERHRHQGPDRLPRGRQDGHHRREHRRVVRRLHPAAGDRRVGRLPQRPHADARSSTTAATSPAARSRPRSGAST